METGAGSRHKVSMKWPVPGSARCTELVFDDPVGSVDVDVIASP